MPAQWLRRHQEPLRPAGAGRARRWRRRPCETQRSRALRPARLIHAELPTAVATPARGSHRPRRCTAGNARDRGSNGRCFDLPSRKFRAPRNGAGPSGLKRAPRSTCPATRPRRRRTAPAWRTRPATMPPGRAGRSAVVPDSVVAGARIDPNRTRRPLGSSGRTEKEHDAERRDQQRPDDIEGGLHDAAARRRSRPVGADGARAHPHGGDADRGLSRDPPFARRSRRVKVRSRHGCEVYR